VVEKAEFTYPIENNKCIIFRRNNILIAAHKKGTFLIFRKNKSKWKNINAKKLGQRGIEHVHSKPKQRIHAAWTKAGWNSDVY